MIVDVYTLAEASKKLKEHNITADYRKLIREAIAGRLCLSIGVHGYFYSPTIKAKCENIVSKYLNKLLDIVNQENSYSDEITCAFETELIREVLNSNDWSILSHDEKISYLINSDSLNLMYERYSNPSLGGYFVVYPKQLLSPVNGSFEIKAVSDGRDMYFSNKTITHDELFICENHLQSYIEVLSDEPQKPQRTNTLYAEIKLLTNWQKMSAYDLLEHLKPFAGHDGSCIVNVNNNTVTWLTRANLTNTTKLNALQKWVKRQQKT